jgi:hypothetical protein
VTSIAARRAAQTIATSSATAALASDNLHRTIIRVTDDKSGFDAQPGDQRLDHGRRLVHRRPPTSASGDRPGETPRRGNSRPTSRDVSGLADSARMG